MESHYVIHDIEKGCEITRKEKSNQGKFFGCKNLCEPMRGPERYGENSKYNGKDEKKWTQDKRKLWRK